MAHSILINGQPFPYTGNRVYTESLEFAVSAVQSGLMSAHEAQAYMEDRNLAVDPDIFEAAGSRGYGAPPRGMQMIEDPDMPENLMSFWQGELSSTSVASGIMQHETAVRHGSGEFELEHIVRQTIVARGDIAFLSERPAEHFRQVHELLIDGGLNSAIGFDDVDWYVDSGINRVTFHSGGLGSERQEWCMVFRRNGDENGGLRFDRIFRILD